MDNDQTQLKNIAGFGNEIKRASWLFLFLLVGCETTKGPVPVVERTVTPESIARISDEKQIDQDRFYIVQKGKQLNHLYVGVCAFCQKQSVFSHPFPVSYTMNRIPTQLKFKL